MSEERVAPHLDDRLPDVQDELPHSDDRLVDLTPVVRRVIAARVRDADVVDDLVQETLTRVMGSRGRVEDGGLAPYAVATARNLAVSQIEAESRSRRNVHRLVDLARHPRPEEEVLRREDSTAVTEALGRLSDRERDLLVAHELDGMDTAALATRLGSTPGAVAAALSRARARLRLEYVLASERLELPSPRCRPVLLAVSAADRRRQRELDASGHLLRCEPCARLASVLVERRSGTHPEAESRIPVRRDADVVAARQRGREVARELGFSATDLTLVATAISEIARNIVRFAERGEITFRTVVAGEREGLEIVARDVGPGIPDVEQALRDGYSTYGGMGLGLPGSRRLMDEFEVTSQVGEGTTVRMTKWLPRKGRRGAQT